ncbi:MAG: hypothetical protein WBP26_00470 [Candidatus Saccharimonadales bacterium]
MPEDNIPNQPNKTFFDVARPGSMPTNATSKPVVVGHGVSQIDPMVRLGNHAHQATGSHQAQAAAMSGQLDGDDVPGAPEVAQPDAMSTPVNPNSIPLDSAEEVEVISGGIPPQYEPESQIGEQLSTTEHDTADTLETKVNVPDMAYATESTPVTEAVEGSLPARGPAASSQKLLPSHTDTDTTELKKPKAKISKLRMFVIVVLSVLVAAAIVVDVLLFVQYLKLK